MACLLFFSKKHGFGFLWGHPKKENKPKVFFLGASYFHVGSMSRRVFPRSLSPTHLPKAGLLTFWFAPFAQFLVMHLLFLALGNWAKLPCRPSKGALCSDASRGKWSCFWGSWCGKGCLDCVKPKRLGTRLGGFVRPVLSQSACSQESPRPSNDWSSDLLCSFFFFFGGGGGDRAIAQPSVSNQFPPSKPTAQEWVPFAFPWPVEVRGKKHMSKTCPAPHHSNMAATSPCIKARNRIHGPGP